MRHVIAAIEHECPGRLQNVEARRALERFHAGTWADASVARQPVGVAASSFGETRVRSERDGRRRSPSGRVLTVLALGLVVAAAVVGFVLARAPGTPGHTAPAHGTRAAAGLLSVALPSGWRQQRLPRNLGLDLTDAVALAPSASAGGVLVIGRTGTSSSTLLPQRLLSALPNAPTTQIVTLGGARFYRYLHLSPSGASGRESVYALPTTVGTVLGVCVEPRASLRFASDCEHVVGTIKLASGSVLAVGPSASYASALNAAITRLNATRSIGASRLRGARTPPEQASAARALAASYYVAASSVGQLSAGVAQPADLDVAAALRSTGDAYAALGRAAARNDAHAYAAARGSVANATSALNVAFARLAKFGYTIA